MINSSKKEQVNSICVMHVFTCNEKVYEVLVNQEHTKPVNFKEMREKEGGREEPVSHKTTPDAIPSSPFAPSISLIGWHCVHFKLLSGMSIPYLQKLCPGSVPVCFNHDYKRKEERILEYLLPICVLKPSLKQFMEINTFNHVLVLQYKASGDSIKSLLATDSAAADV